LTLPLVNSSAFLAKNSAALPLGVSLATTWLNLMTIGCWAEASSGTADRTTVSKPKNNFEIFIF